MPVHVVFRSSSNTAEPVKCRKVAIVRIPQLAANWALSQSPEEQSCISAGRRSVPGHYPVEILTGAQHSDPSGQASLRSSISYSMLQPICFFLFFPRLFPLDAPEDTALSFLYQRTDGSVRSDSMSSKSLHVVKHGVEGVERIIGQQNPVRTGQKGVAFLRESREIVENSSNRQAEQSFSNRSTERHHIF